MLHHTTPLWKIPPEDRRAFLHARARALSAEGANPRRLLRASDSAHTVDYREPRQGEGET
ncbi:hypothetical protein [Kitasatospora sp. MBT66]|uniref:hypothetical protein n=1 Tax=Kitasatospora sp. MBT66 TaxID=1444769 RepID=UPI0005B7E4EE|nr:hypothetical protein [Kitasatospora sp. MBT66]